jgi:hypothetical protein
MLMEWWNLGVVKQVPNATQLKQEGPHSDMLTRSDTGPHTLYGRTFGLQHMTAMSATTPVSEEWPGAANCCGFNKYCRIQ